MFLSVKRKELGMSQKEVAYKIGIQPTALSNYELNRRQPPIDILIKLADLFGCTIDELVRGWEYGFWRKSKIKERPFERFNKSG